MKLNLSKEQEEQMEAVSGAVSAQISATKRGSKLRFGGKDFQSDMLFQIASSGTFDCESEQHRPMLTTLAGDYRGLSVEQLKALRDLGFTLWIEKAAEEKEKSK